MIKLNSIIYKTIRLYSIAKQMIRKKSRTPQNIELYSIIYDTIKLESRIGGYNVGT